MAIEFIKEWLIICEGGADKAFFAELIRRRSLPDFQIQYPRREGDDTGGFHKYGRFLNEIQINEGFIQNVRAILVTADNDDDPATRFTEIQEQIRNVGGYGVPDLPLQVARSVRDLPNIVIMMMPPDGTPGNLESVLLPAAYSKWPGLQSPLTDYINSSPAKDWEPRKQAKARLRSIVSATCKQKPDTPYSLLWGRPEEYHIPVDHDSLDSIADILERFGDMIA